MQTPPRIKMHNRNHLWRCSFAPAAVLLTVLAQLVVLPNAARAWQYADNQQVFPNRHPDFYHPPANPNAANQFINTQNLYNQPLNLPLQQQFLTPSSTNVIQPPTASDQAVQPVDQQVGSEPFSALFAPNSRIASPPSGQQQQHQQPTVAAMSDAPKSMHEQPINARDTSQQQARPVDTTSAQIKSSEQDHDIVQSPSPLGKILDVVARETVSALSGSISAGKEATTARTTTTTTTTTTKDAKQQAPSLPAAAEGKVTHATKSESDSAGRQANEQVVLHLKPLTQAMAAAAQKKRSDKNAVNSIEQQIINQHARATSYATLHSRRYEPPTAAPSAPQQLVRLLPTKHRGDTKLFTNLLSTLAGGGGGGGHNSASGSADSSAQPAAGGPLSSLVDNFKSGISSRSSIVKAAISDNKLARTLSTVGKTIGGNKYVASAGAAAALAALGLTVSKFLGPYVMAGSYSKLGGAGPMEPLLTAGSYLQPSYLTSGGFAPSPDRNFHYLPPGSLGGGGGGLSDSMLAAAATGSQQPTMGQYLESQYEPGALGQLQSAFNSYAGQQQTGASDLTSSPTGGANIYASYRPSGTTTGGGGSLVGTPHRSTGGSLSSQKSAFDAGANGHYSSFYNSQPEYEQQNGGGGGLDASSQFGSYISGAPTAGGGEFAGYSSSGAFDSSATTGQPTSGYQVDLGAANTYEPAGTNSQQQQFDQIMSSASSDTPTYANSPPPPAISRVSFPSKTAAPHHRSGAVMLKLDEATRNLIRQQLQAELAARAAPTSYNYNHLTLNSARPRQQQQQRQMAGAASLGVDQSSGAMTTSQFDLSNVPMLVPMTDQRAGAADSSGDYATFVQWQPQSSSAAPQQRQGGAARSGTIESNYNDAQLAAGQRRTNQAHLGQQQGQFVASGGARANNNLSAHNSIRPQMQTKRNEPAASSAYVLIRPQTMRASAAPVDSSPSLSSSSSSSSVTGREQQVRAQPQLVPIVGSSRSSAATQWNSVVGKQADRTTSGGGGGGDKKLPAATVGSLDSPTSGPTALESGDHISFDKTNDSKTSSSLNRAARTPQAARAAPVQLAEERANNSDAWLVPAGFDQLSLIRDYEVLAAQQQHQPPVDGSAAAPAPQASRKPHEEMGSKSGQSSSAQQDDELLQVASRMRASLIQLGDGQTPTTGGRAQSTVADDGAEYQLDTVDGDGQQEAAAATTMDGSEIEENNPFDDKRQGGARGNKLIEAKTNTNNGALVVADGGKPPSAQHDKRHRSQSASMSSQRQQRQQLHQQHQHRATTTTSGAGGGDNVLVELPASVSAAAAATQQRQEQVTPPATTTTTTTETTVDQHTLSSQLSQVAVDGETKDQHRKAFRGIVAGGLGGAGV